jgi:hypothetical protein
MIFREKHPLTLCTISSDLRRWVATRRVVEYPHIVEVGLSPMQIAARN